MGTGPHTGPGVLQCDPIADPGWSSFPEGLHPIEGIHDSAVHKELQPVGGSCTGEVHAVFTLMGGTYAVAEEQWEETSP